MLSKLARAFVVATVAIAAQGARAHLPCSIVGNPVTLEVTGALAGNATAIVQSGAIEFDPAPGNSALSVDIAGATVRIFNNSPSTSVTFDLAAEYGVTLDGPLALSIVGVTAAANGVTGFTAGSVTRTPHSVVFTATGTTWPAGASLTISLETSCLDIDGSGSNDALTDGLLLLRYLFGLRGAPLIDSALGPGATRTTAAEVESYLAGIAPALDVDGDGSADALTDGLLMLRYFFGLRGGPLVAAAIGPNATRGDATLIETHLHGLVTAPFNQPPQVGAGSDQSITLPNNASLSAQVVDDGLPNPPGVLTLSWMMVSGPGMVSFANAAAPTTDASFSVAGTYVLRLNASDGAASAASDITVTVAASQGPGPDPSTLAPPIDPTVPSSIYDTTAFLYMGPNPPQTGVVPGTIRVARVAILRGRVLDRSGAALSGVRLTIRNHPEFGQTLSRLDGRFDIVVNGGETITLDYAKSGFLPVQRQKAVPWQDFVMVDDVVMISVDAQMTTIASGAMSMQVARGTMQSDASGTRQGTVMIPAGTSASLVQPDGSLVAVNSISVRLTEYTVGPSGPRAMPGELPPTSGYTYAVELGADEAVAKVNGRDIVFSQPVSFYVENFLAFPVGTVVPVGFYDPDKMAWVPSQSGRVVKILSISGGMANIDADGDGLADGAPELAALGITDAERQQLATLYAVGQTLWRMQTTHFSTWDCNWPFGPPPDAIKPNRPKPKPDGRPKGPCDDNGSIITCESQSLGEAINVTGTPFSLHYSSDRARGRKGAYRLQIPLSGGTLPASLVRIELTVAIAGRQFAQTFPASINQSHEFEWDGMDAYGRSLEGAAIATVRVGYVYGGVYQKTTRFGYNGDGAISGSQSRQEVTLWQESRSTLGVFRGQVGGWMLDVHHTYDPVAKTLYRGNGRRQDGQDALGAVMHTVAGTGQCCYSGDGGAATQARITKPLAIAYAADGSWYFSDLEQIVVRKVSAEGVITTVAGNNISGFSGDGGPATAASLTYPQGVALGPDGSLYIGDFGRVRRVAPDGTISTFAGNGTHVTSGDGGPATQAGIAGAFGLDLALGADGTLYIAGGGAMRRVSPDGIISSIVVPGTQTALTPSKIALGADGSLYLSGPGHSISRLSPDGVISPVAGTGVSGFTGDGGPAVQARVKFPDSIALGPDGTIYFSDFGNHRVRRIGPDGIINTLTGTGTFGDYGGDGGPAGQAKLNGPIGLAIGPDNALLIADPGNRRVRRVGSPMPGLAISDLVLAATDGTEVYAFAGNGRHLLTRAALSGVVKYQFGYDAQGRLSTVTDRDARVTTISRDAGGSPTAVMSPAGQSTTLVTNGSGWLASIADPGGGTTQLTYSVDGLLMTETDPGGGLHKFTYDAAGRLTKDEGPGGSVKALTRVENPDGYTITMTTGLGRVSTFQVQELPSGTVRRLTADATGAITESLLKPDGTQTTTYPDGETVTLTAGPDPRLGMQSPRAVKVVRSLPGGQIFTATSQRTATLATPTDLFSLQTLTDSWTINGQSANRVYDAATRTMTATSAEGRKVIGVLDAKGRLISRTLATGLAPYQFTYDSKGLIVEVKQGAQYWTLAYDAQDRLITRSDAAGQTIGYGYDSSNRLVQQTLPSGIMYQYSYDANGNRTHVILPGGNDHALGYAADGLFNSYAPPGNGSYTRTFDADRRLTRTTLPAGRFAERTFDANARILQIAYPEVTQTFEYFTNDKTDRARRIIQTPASGPAQEMLYSYNGSLVGSITASGAAPAQVTYAYNNDLLPTSMQLVSGADTVTTALAWDKDGAGTGFGPFTLTRAGPGGALSKISDGGLNVTYVYDTLGRITSRTHTVGNVAVYSAQLTYGISGRIASRTETIGGVSHSQVYTYDLDGRLTGVQRDGVADEIYAYDVRGNRTSRTIGAGAAQVATYDAQDRLQQRATVTYVVNADGFLAQRGADTFQYSTRGQLLQATVGGQPITYAYDGLGRRVSRTTAAGTYEFLYGDPASHLVTAVRDTDGQLTTLYYDSAGLLFALQRGAARYYVATDQVGTPRVVTDNAGVIVKQLEFDTFGVELTDTAPGFDLPIGYAGGIADAPTGLVHFGFRDYEPASGRWTARDPALFDGGQGNLFAYVDNNPVGNRDPTGLICVSVTMYKGYGGGTQTCIGLEGASVCAEIGVGAGGGIGVDLLGVGTGGLGLFGGPLDKTGVVTENAEAVLECGPFEVGAAAALSMEGCFSAGFKSSLEFQEALKNRVKGDSYYFADFFKGKCKLEAKWNAKICWSEKW